jgi:hypothetical protein
VAPAAVASQGDLPASSGTSFLSRTYSYSHYGFGRRSFRETRLRIERWWLQKKMERNRKKSNLRVIPGQGKRERDGKGGNGEVRQGPWTH